MGYAADDFEAIRKHIDDNGLDSSGKSLRDQARKAQAIDRDLPGVPPMPNWQKGIMDMIQSDRSHVWKSIGIDLASGPDKSAQATGITPSAARRLKYNMIGKARQQGKSAAQGQVMARASLDARILDYEARKGKAPSIKKIQKWKRELGL